ncbi:DUF6602 domain-containing protein [Sorangium sp. So ce260]|uniref:DUF6602 domain-containing protein n=1 Tax=Sorangium sp. So ce260 TaxID=3133291 RepID=UPI003F5F86C5
MAGPEAAAGVTVAGKGTSTKRLARGGSAAAERGRGRRGAPAGDAEEPPDGREAAGREAAPPRRAFYGGWSEEIVEHLEDEFRKLRALATLELGPELEIAICQALRKFLPERAGVCRGWVVDTTGDRQGDDIIIYDAARFPTLRGLGGDLAIRERVPAEAVLAYIEVKHTLYAQAKVPAKSQGQALVKACRQVAAVKGLHRAPVPLETIAPRIELENAVKRNRGFPAIRNPWYAAIWALNLRVDKDLAHNPAEAVKRRIAAVRRAGTRAEHLPDVIAAGPVLMTPAIVASGVLESRPFTTPDTELIFTNGMKALGAAVEHLTWAIDDILLGEIPWRRMLEHQLRRADEEAGSVRLRLP